MGGNQGNLDKGLDGFREAVMEYVRFLINKCQTDSQK